MFRKHYFIWVGWCVKTSAMFTVRPSVACQLDPRERPSEAIHERDEGIQRHGNQLCCQLQNEFAGKLCLNIDSIRNVYSPEYEQYADGVGAARNRSELWL